MVQNTRLVPLASFYKLLVCHMQEDINAHYLYIYILLYVGTVTMQISKCPSLQKGKVYHVESEKKL